MSTRTKRIIIILATAQLIVAIGIFLLPQIVKAMPTRYQLAVQERLPASVELFEAVTTPIPDLPSSEVALEEIAIPTVIFSTPTEEIPAATPTVAATATEVQAVAEIVEEPDPTATEPPPTPTSTPKPLPVNARLDGVTNIPQGFNNCGPANLSIVLNFHGNETTQTEAASYLKPNPEDRNTSPWQLRDYVNDFTGMSSSAHSGGDLELIKRLIVAGYPVIVEKGYDPNTTEGWYGHYLTVFGYDDETRIFNAMDTYLGPFTVDGSSETYDDINEYWRHFNYTFVVIYPAAEEAIVQDILGAEMVDERTMWQNAAIKAQADIEKDPDDAFAWFNLGTSMTRLGELSGEGQFYSDGAAAFDNARALGLPYRMLWYQFRPYIAYMKTARYQDMIDLADATLETAGGRNVEETYLYRGHANAWLGNTAQAISDYERAIELNSNFYPAEIARDSLGG